MPEKTFPYIEMGCGVGKHEWRDENDPENGDRNDPMCKNCIVCMSEENVGATVVGEK